MTIPTPLWSWLPISASVGPSSAVSAPMSSGSTGSQGKTSARSLLRLIWTNTRFFGHSPTKRPCVRRRESSGGPRYRAANVRFYVDADVLGLAKVLVQLRPDVTYPGDPGGVIHKRRRDACPIKSPGARDQ